MADYVTTNTTAADPPTPSLMQDGWTFKDGVDFSGEMTAVGDPETLIPSGSGGGGRPSVGMVFPH